LEVEQEEELLHWTPSSSGALPPALEAFLLPGDLGIPDAPSVA
jgi:hypothetical protein